MLSLGIEFLLCFKNGLSWCATWRFVRQAWVLSELIINIGTVYTDRSKLKLSVDGASLMPQTVARGAGENWK